MKRIVLVLFLLLSQNIFADDNKSIYLNLLNERKYDELIKHLEKWETIDSMNPELYIAFFNYYIAISRSESIDLNKQKKDQKSLVLTDPKTNEIVGYMNFGTYYDPQNIQSALVYINKGLSLSKNRLDMHFGKIHLLNQIKDYKTASVSLSSVLKISVENHNKWLWADNLPKPDAENFLLTCVQDYYNAWLTGKTPESLEATKTNSELQIKCYPNHIYAYNNLAVYYFYNNNYNQALNYLLKAEKINSKDIFVLNNIAYTYKQLSNISKAKEYYNKILSYGNDEDKEFAKKQLGELK